MVCPWPYGLFPQKKARLGRKKPQNVRNMKSIRFSKVCTSGSVVGGVVHNPIFLLVHL